MFKRFMSGLLAAAVVASGASLAAPEVNVTADAASNYNYAEIMDMSMFFYEAQQAGPLPEWNRVEWRCDSTMDDPVLGGWYDAGDHVKFNLPMAYSASMLAWGLYQYPDGLEKTDLMETYVNNLTFALDYLAKCDLGDEVIYQVGIGKVDHTWWGPVSLLKEGMEDSGQDYKEVRQALKSDHGCTAVFGEMAAALAAGYASLQGRVDKSKLDDYLEHAKNIYNIAKESPDDEVYNLSDANGFYRSRHYYDQLFYAANWLYIATGDKEFLDDAKDFIPYLDRELGQPNVISYGWCHCWDDNLQGAMLLYAINTGDKDAIAHVKKHLKYWLNAEGVLVLLDGGLRWLNEWGCLRYANTAAFIAEVASDTIFKGEDNTSYTDFAETQLHYALGENPDNYSYLIGYGENYPQNPHHRTAHGSWKNDVKVPSTTRHILYGGLVGGPDKEGNYDDNDRDKYFYTEVATDYNAGFTALLCKMLDQYGGKRDPEFPPKEVHDGPEFFVESLLKESSAGGVTISFKLTNHSAWPARVQDNLSFRYYMDLSEVIEAGKDPEQLVIRCDRDQAAAMYGDKGVSGAVISKPKKYDGNIYYIEVTLPDGRAVLPISEGSHQCEILLAIVMPDYLSTGWDSTNDPSFKELKSSAASAGADGKAKGVVSPYVPVYVNGELYYGYEPDGTYKDGLGDSPKNKPEPSSDATDPVTEEDTYHVSPPVTLPDPTKIAGDANGDTEVNMSDVVLVMQSSLNPKKYGINGTSEDCMKKENEMFADVDGVTGVSATDALLIQKYTLKLVDKLTITFYQ